MANVVQIIIDGKDQFSSVSDKVRREMNGLERDAETMGQRIAGGMARASMMVGAAGLGIAAGIGKITLEHAKYAEQVREVQRLTGQSAEDASRLINAADDVGIAYETMSRSMAIFSKNTLEIQRTDASGGALGTTAQLLETIGVKALDASGNVRPMKDLLLELADVFATMPDGPTKTAIAMDLFGRSGADMIPLLNEGAEGIRRLNDEADKWGQTLDQEAVDAAHAFTLANRDLSDAVESLQIKIATAAIPTLTELARAFSHGLESGENFERFMKGAALGLAGIWINAMTLISNAIISGFEAALNFVIDKYNDLRDNLKVPDFVPGVGGNNLLPGAGNVSLRRAEFVDPMAGLRAAFPDITQKADDATDALRKTNPAMQDFSDKTKEIGDRARSASQLLEELSKGELTLETARKSGGMGAGDLTDPSVAGALEAYAMIREARFAEAEAAFELETTLSRIAAAYYLNRDAGEEMVLTLERETKAKIDSAMADLFGKGTREQAQMQLQILTLDREMQRRRLGGASDKPGEDTARKAVEARIAQLERELSAARFNQFGRDKDGTVGSSNNMMQRRIELLENTLERERLRLGAMGPGGRPADAQLLYMERQKQELEDRLRLARTESQIREQTIKVHDRSIPTDAEQARMARNLTGMMATTTSDLRDLSMKTRKEMIPSVDDATRAFQASDGAARVLADDAFRDRLIPRGYDVAGAFEAITAAANAKDGAAAELRLVAQAAAEARGELGKIKGGGGGGGGGNSIKPPNVGDGGIKPLGSSIGSALGSRGM